MAATAIVAIVAVVLGAGTGHESVLLLAVLLAAGVICWVMPLDLLPVAALLPIFFFPSRSLPVPTILQGVPVGVLPLAVWLVRTPPNFTRSGPTRALGVALFSWMVLSELFASPRTTRGVVWFLTASVALALVAVRSGSSFPSERFRSAFLWLATIVGTYALIEVFVVHGNPLYGPLYLSAEHPLRQTWSTYRATTTVGHPLVNGTIFAIAGVLAVNAVLEARGRLPAAVAKCVVIFGALVSTYSRTAVVAVAIGTSTLLVLRPSTGISGLRRAVVTGGMIGIIAVGASALAERSTSTEGRESVANRQGLYARTTAALNETSIFGAGPGEAEPLRLEKQLASPTTPALESAYAQLAVGLGVAGLLIVAALLFSAVASGVRVESATGGASALLAAAAAVGGYNALDGHPELIVLIGLLLAGVLADIADSQLRERSADMPTKSQRRVSTRDKLRIPG